jgi:mono/diheme cytochrome c family protein
MIRKLTTLLGLLAAMSPLPAPQSSAAEPAPGARVGSSPPPDSAPVSGGAFDPERAWLRLGCSGCHGDGGIFRDETRGALGKPVGDVASWIRDAPSIKPDTDMPSFEDELDEANATVLARWVLQRAAHL